MLDWRKELMETNYRNGNGFILRIYGCCLKDHHITPRHTGEHNERKYGQSQAMPFDTKDRAEDGVRLEDEGMISFGHIS